MENKKIGYTIGLLFLMYCSAFGNYLNSGNDYLYDNGSWLAIIDLLLCSLAMMIVPFIWRLINKKRFSREKGKNICKWNSIICFIISIILMITTDISFIGGLGAIMYYFINKWLFVDENNLVKEIKKENNKTEELYSCDNCGYTIKESDKVCPNCHLKFDDEDEEIDDIEEEVTGFKCDECGAYVHEDDTICPKCGASFDDDIDEKNDKFDNADKKYDSLLKLKKLYDKEIITKEEFEKEKRKLLK